MKLSRNLRAIKWFFKSYTDFERPVYGTFKVTHRCNLRCPFCDVIHQPMRDLPTKDVFRIIDHLAESTVTVLSLEGGEPTLRRDILEIIKYAHDSSFYLFMTTNGTLLHRMPVEKFAKYLDFLHISIDEGHNNLHLFNELPKYTKIMKVTVQTVVTRNDINSLRWRVEKAHEAGARILVMSAVHLPGTPNIAPDRQELHDLLVELKREYGSTIETSWAFIDALIKPYKCQSFSVTIDANGDVIYPCAVIAHRVGNLVKQDLESILTSEKAVKAREIMHNCDRRCMLYLHAETSQFHNLHNLARFVGELIGGYMKR